MKTTKKTKEGIVLGVVLLLAMGCSAHSPFILKTTTDVANLSQNNYLPHQERIFLTYNTLPDTARFERIAKIDVGRIWYGAVESVYGLMARKAKELGADAVIEIKTWHQPSGLAWAAPHGSGIAIKILDPSSVDLSKVVGTWQH